MSSHVLSAARRASRATIFALCATGLVSAACGSSGDDLFGESAASGTGAGPAGPGGAGGAGASGGSGATGNDGGAGAQGGGGSGAEGGVPAGCGNGTLDDGEACDGAELGGQSCADLGFSDPAGLTCDGTCQLDDSGCHTTCDGAALETGEECDGEFLGGATCTDLGYSDPYGLACAACQIDAGGCEATCGDDHQEPGEVCDGDDLGGQTCKDFGYVAAEGLSCEGACQVIDPAGCTAACNGTLEPTEECDGANLGALSCIDFGFAEAQGLTCVDCQPDASGCQPVCGNGVIEPGETCDEGDSVPGDGCSATCQFEGTTCSNAIPVTVDLGAPTVIAGSTVGGGAHDSMACPAPGADRIYAVTAASGGYLTASLSRPAGTFDSVLYAREQCQNANSLILCADSTDSLSPSPLFGGELVSFPVQNGQTVFVFVDGKADGDYQLSLNLSTGASCNDPVPLLLEAGSPMTVIGTTNGFGNQESSTCGGATSEDVVYEVTRAETGPLAMALPAAQTGYDSLLYAQPLCGVDLNSLCDNEAGNGGESISIGSVTGDDPFYLWVDGFSGAEGPYTLVLDP